MNDILHLMLSELPAHAKVSRDVSSFMQEVVSEFIGFITSEANDICVDSKQKTMCGKDIMTALSNLGEAAIPFGLIPSMFTFPDRHVLTPFKF